MQWYLNIGIYIDMRELAEDRGGSYEYEQIFVAMLNIIYIALVFITVFRNLKLFCGRWSGKAKQFGWKLAGDTANSTTVHSWLFSLFFFHNKYICSSLSIGLILNLYLLLTFRIHYAFHLLRSWLSPIVHLLSDFYSSELTGFKEEALT